MRKTKIVTTFLTNSDKILLLKRSQKVKSMKNLWAGISGIIEGNEQPLERAKIEVYEEVGIKESNIELIKEGKIILIESPQYENHQWEVYPFLFSCNNIEIKLNWENSESKWINVNELNEFKTVPSLDRVLTRLF
ncbi:MAG: NUDIX domain-containing protein [Thaumarchaeota archaeon]|nr:NUDIX domain-containing protein [Nitrososphaerota archaeon]MBT3743531.1 NUDIX domain-containing protein [Nitrososphaerota archaeon]MBT4057837.1 NUDIX domain-containing protein [Nitrososphaerota archaeon]MBT4176544.1 NUDIX domain-containing protein [Nitrososphaerota archaeon]MBT4509315.1 NUDIX domain-containing protein [Nitrososphaerota archaeon]